MSKGSKQQTPTSQTVTQSSIPEEFYPYLERTLQRAEGVSNRGYEAYAGPRLAGFSGDTVASFDTIRGNQGSYRPFLDRAGAGVDAATSAAGSLSTGTWNRAAADQYMDPYIGKVMDAQRARQEQSFGREMAGIGQLAARTGAFGGSRHGILEARARDNFEQRMNETEASMLSDAYRSGAQIFSSDQARALDAGRARMEGLMQGADASARLGQMSSSMGYQDAEALRRIGLTQEQLDQAGLDLDYNDFTNQRDYDRQNVAFLSGILRGTPMPISSEVTSTQFNNPYAQALGLGLGLYGFGQNQGAAG